MKTAPANVDMPETCNGCSGSVTPIPNLPSLVRVISLVLLDPLCQKKLPKVPPRLAASK